MTSIPRLYLLPNMCYSIIAMMKATRTGSIIISSKDRRKMRRKKKPLMSLLPNKPSVGVVARQVTSYLTVLPRTLHPRNSGR